MTVRSGVPLSSLTTLRVGGLAHAVIDVTSVDELTEALAYAKAHSLPYMVIGEGSNLLAPDEGYEGVVLRMQIPGLSFKEKDDVTLVTAGAGYSWDRLVTKTTERGLWGIENLAGIPGTVGAAPVQNIGAYGTELEEALASVEAYETGAGVLHTFTRDECGFSYRDSRFKREPGFVITKVTFALRTDGAPQLRYADLTRAVEAGIQLTTPTEVAHAVRAIRARKFPDLSVCGSAGSFFKNPIITEAEYSRLLVRFADIIDLHGLIPRYPLQKEGEIKIPLAYILDKILGLRGYRRGKVYLYQQQPLVLVTDAGATAHDVNELADDVAKKVFDATHIMIEREVRSLT